MQKELCESTELKRWIVTEIIIIIIIIIIIKPVIITVSFARIDLRLMRAIGGATRSRGGRTLRKISRTFNADVVETWVISRKFL